MALRRSAFSVALGAVDTLTATYDFSFPEKNQILITSIFIGSQVVDGTTTRPVEIFGKAIFSRPTPPPLNDPVLNFDSVPPITDETYTAGIYLDIDMTQKQIFAPGLIVMPEELLRLNYILAIEPALAAFGSFFSSVVFEYEP